MVKKVRIGIIGLNKIIVNTYTILCTNCIVRRNSVRFLYGTDLHYFENLIKLLRGEKLNKRLYISFVIIKNKLLVEMYPSILLEQPPKIYFDSINSIILLLENSNQQFNNVKLLKYVYYMTRKGIIFSKKTRKPTAIIKLGDMLNNDKIDKLIKNRFTRFKSFKFKDPRITELIRDAPRLESILEKNTELNTICQPLIWLLTRKI